MLSHQVVPLTSATQVRRSAHVIRDLIMACCCRLRYKTDRQTDNDDDESEVKKSNFGGVIPNEAGIDLVYCPLPVFSSNNSYGNSTYNCEDQLKIDITFHMGPNCSAN